MPLPRYTIRQLDTFLTVADTLSFTEAGNRLGLTASAVSQLIVELENEVGFRLFDRSTRRVGLSSAGKEFLGPADMVLRHLRLAETAAADLRKGSTGLVRVAAPMVIASHILPKIVRSYTEQHPRVAVRIRDASVEQMVDLVEAGDVDLALGPDRTSGDSVMRVPLFKSPWVLWCSPEHPLAQKKTVAWGDLRQESLVAAGRDHERNVSQMRASLPESERITPVDVVENISTALGIAAAGLAATLAPAYVAVMAELLGLVMRRITDPEVMREVSLYLPMRRVASPAALGFAEFLASAYDVDLSNPAQPA
jgi:DNA-binding transcriptional LysR family regulator